MRTLLALIDSPKQENERGSEYIETINTGESQRTAESEESTAESEESTAETK